MSAIRKSFPIERTISVQPRPRGPAVTVVEAFEYKGTQSLDRRACLLAPRTLCQFDCGDGCETVFPDGGMPAVLEPGARLAISVTTEYSHDA